MGGHGDPILGTSTAADIARSVPNDLAWAQNRAAFPFCEPHPQLLQIGCRSRKALNKSTFERCCHPGQVRAHLDRRPGAQDRTVADTFWTGPLALQSQAPDRRREGGLSGVTEVGADLFGASLVRLPCVEQRERRAHEDVEVEQDRPVLDVVEVVLDAPADLFRRVGLAAPAVDLGPAGDARLDLVAGEVAVDDFVVEAVAGLGLRACGRGPTSESSPRSTLNSCGSSSSASCG